IVSMHTIWRDSPSDLHSCLLHSYQVRAHWSGSTRFGGIMVAQSRTPSQSRHLLLMIALVVVGLGLVSFFGTRAYRAYHRLQQPELASGTTDIEAIRGWMTL